MKVMSGIKATSETIGDPHAGQNRLATGWPLSPVSWNVFVSPVTVKADLGIATTTENAVPACF